MPRDEIPPDLSLVEAVRGQVLPEITERLARELRHTVVLDIFSHQDSARVGDHGTWASRKKKGPAQKGEVRLRFRPTGDTNLFLFLAEGRLEKDERCPTYSGFIVEGHVTREASTGACTATFKGWLVLHNEWEWNSDP